MVKKLMVTGLGAVLLSVAAAASPLGWVNNAERTTYLTFNRAVALPGAQLPAGTYIFERVTPITNAELVRVMSRDRRKVYLMDFTRLINRPPGRHDDSLVTLGEAARGAAPPVLRWFPGGSDQGHEFIYKP